MKNPRLFVVDAFTDRIFSGNTAAICLSEHELDDSLMQNIAMENRFSETAFITPLHTGWNLRWFTPGGEIDLCGHATLASAYIIFKYYETGSKKIVFHTKSGPLPVLKDGAFYSMDFPAFAIHQVEVTEQMADAVGARPIEA